jgi:hypothetical protein
VYLYASHDLGHGDSFGSRSNDVRDALGRGGGIVRCGGLGGRRWSGELERRVTSTGDVCLANERRRRMGAPRLLRLQAGGGTKDA